MEQRTEPRIDIIDVDAKNKGLLKSYGERRVLAMVEKLPGARAEDTEMLMLEIRNAYSRYIHRVHEYSTLE